MDNAAANKNHIQCLTWLDQSGWSSASSQGLSVNLQSNPQNLTLGSTSDQRPLFGLLETSHQSSVSNLNSSTSRNNSLLKAANMTSMFSSNSIFHGSAISTASHGTNFASPSPYTSSGLAASSQMKTIPQLSQQNQGLQACGAQNVHPQPPNYKMFQTPVPGHGLAHGLQDQSFGLSSCGQNVNMPQATFGGQSNDNRYPNSFSSLTSMEQPQWVPSSSSGGAVSFVPANVNKAPSLEKGFPPATDGNKRRSSILNQRAQLLKQLENLNKLLESLPSDDSNEGEPSNADAQTWNENEEAEQCRPAGNCSPPSVCNEPRLSGTLASPQSPAESREVDSDYAPQSEVSFSDSQSDSGSLDYLSRSNTASPTNNIVKEEEISEDTLSEEEYASSSKKTLRNVKKKKKSGMVVVQTIKRTAKSHNSKLNYCLFCGRPLTKMARHLTGVHGDQVEVAVALQYPANSKERKNIWQKLINNGNFKHNKDVLKTGKGQLAVRVRSSIPSNATDYVHCIYCYGLIRKQRMHIHMKRCTQKIKKEDNPQEGRKRIISQCALLTKNCEGVSEDFKNLLGKMVYDNVTETVMENRIMLQFGEQMFEEQMLNKNTQDLKKQEYVRQNLRHVARLLLEAQKSTPMQSLEDFFKPSNFKHLVFAVRVLTGYDPEKKLYARASLALRLGYHLKKICGIIERNAQSCGDTKAVKSCQIFLSLYHKKWTKQITSCALSNIKDIKREKANEVPSVQDVKRLHYYLETVHQAADKKLRENVCPENFAALAKVVLARTIVFNRRLPGEVSSLTVEAFQSRIRSNVCDDMDLSVSKLEKKLCCLFSRINIRGSCGRVVPIILKPSLESSLELLIEVREACRILSTNQYLFPRQLAPTPHKGTFCVQIHAKKCGAEDPSTLRVLKLRRHFATLLQLINLDDEEIRQVLGPNSDIQALRQINDTMCDDSLLESGGPLQFFQQRRGSASCSLADAEKKRREGFHSKAKLPWNKGEAEAVEKHLMTFIEKHKIPQKKDCFRCLEAEPEALRKRSWRGVKDYVRNRITALQRRAGLSKKTANSRTDTSKHIPKQSSAPPKLSDGEKKTRENPSTGPSSGSGPSSGFGPSVFHKEKGSDLRHKAKPKWDRAEVHAVEKHLMRFIVEHKLPQKDDCVRCVEAEPHALRNRTWRGVKDYVRNRITALQRQSGFSKDQSKTKSQLRQGASQSSGTFQSPNGQEAVLQHYNLFPSCSFGPSNLYQPLNNGVTSSYIMNAPPKSSSSKEKAPAGTHPKSKRTWNEAEVSAVEKHLLSFITKQKLPHKDDCVRCLEAEPHALENRSWKGVKDYVRNRITSLQRQSGILRTAPKSNRSRKDEPQQSSGHYHQL
ncbi:uncharacterized protein LOC119788455 isoform X2 [Cyprinodon tularosa]|uniref:uncharacterized protein LOC119788455 isoform X2 n=1 Tax=Cyprinodon tularosa TaxID=77115 RepID=UPI0018E267C5|nr:uncharacterized protein LOC119788455 isoform X2 [Cyprinodon tularosa]